MGGLVRSTGSGMGCPDWPKCFGMFVPPISGSELPANYKEIFLEKRIKKVEKFASFLERSGFAEKAALLRNSKTILEPEVFNPVKAWIEYINRIFGVFAGLFALAFVISAFQFLKQNPKIWCMVFLGFIMLLFNAWLGSIVVATNLLPGIVTVHFMAAFICLFLFLFSIHLAQNFVVTGNNPRKTWLLMFFISMLIVLLGAYSRETADLLASMNLLADDGILNVNQMGTPFVLHRFLPILLLSILFLYLHRTPMESAGRTQANWAILLIMIQILLGMANIFYVLPVWSQTAHIFLGSSLPVLFFYMSIAKTKMIPVTT